jgi:hypothetical protein
VWSPCTRSMATYISNIQINEKVNDWFKAEFRRQKLHGRTNCARLIVDLIESQFVAKRQKRRFGPIFPYICFVKFSLFCLFCLDGNLWPIIYDFYVSQFVRFVCIRNFNDRNIVIVEMEDFYTKDTVFINCWKHLLNSIAL